MTPDTTFGVFSPSGGGGTDYALVQEDFPFYKLNNPEDRDSGTIQDINDVASSQGVLDIVLANGDGKVRKVEPRNTPTILNSSLNFDNFWDGRAKWTFNNEVIGRRVSSPILVGSTPGSAVPVDMKDISDDDLHPGSDGSQSVGPPRSDFEMSCAGRSFKQIGKKMHPLRPLKHQNIAPTDSVFAGMIHSSGKGLAGRRFGKYENAIKQVFKKKYWGETDLDRFGYTC